MQNCSLTCDISAMQQLTKSHIVPFSTVKHANRRTNIHNKLFQKVYKAKNSQELNQRYRTCSVKQVK